MLNNIKDNLTNWASINEERLSNSISRQVINGDNLSLVQLTMKSGAYIDTHSHPNEQMTWILSGHIIFNFGLKLENHIELKTGDILHLPANVPHNALCLQDTIDIDIFTPVRSDWSEPGGNNYLLQAK